MALQKTDNLTNAITTRYTSRYQRAAAIRRIYDQLSMPVSAPQFDLESRRGMGSTYTFNFASDMTPGSTAISEIVDIIPQILRDATSTITPTSRSGALKWSELVDLQAYTDYVAIRAEKLGENAMETIESLAIAAGLAGSLVVRNAARASLNAGTAGDTWTEAAFWNAKAVAEGLRCPYISDAMGRNRIAIAHPDTYYDLFHGGNVQTAATYQDLSILLNGEVGMIGGFRLIISPWAKVFGGAGADNSTGSSQTYVLSAAAEAMDKTLSVTTGTNVVNGRLLTVGTEETANTFYPKNERVMWVSGTTTATIVGSAANGGVRFDHPVTDYVLNADSVYPVVYGAPGSLVKVYAEEVGPFGEFVGPMYDGLAKQWQSSAWKFYGNYGRVAENQILRGEYSSSLDA